MQSQFQNLLEVNPNEQKDHPQLSPSHGELSLPVGYEVCKYYYVQGRKVYEELINCQQIVSHRILHGLTRAYTQKMVEVNQAQYLPGAAEIKVEGSDTKHQSPDHKYQVKCQVCFASHPHSLVQCPPLLSKSFSLHSVHGLPENLNKGQREKYQD